MGTRHQTTKPRRVMPDIPTADRMDQAGRRMEEVPGTPMETRANRLPHLPAILDMPVEIITHRLIPVPAVPTAVRAGPAVHRLPAAAPDSLMKVTALRMTTTPNTLPEGKIHRMAPQANPTTGTADRNTAIPDMLPGITASPSAARARWTSTEGASAAALIFRPA